MDSTEQHPPIRNTARLGEPVVDPAAWHKSHFEDNEDWIYHLTEAEIVDLKKMGAQAHEKFGDDPNAFLDTRTADYDLGCFATKLDTIRHDLRDGIGIALLRGLPFADMDRLEVAYIYWGIGRHIGEAVSNNPEGDMIGHVIDTGRDYTDPKHRGYQTNVEMDYHCDQCDIVTLLCTHTAKSGGKSKVVSSLAMYNEMVKRRPDLVPVLAEPYCWTMHSEIDDGKKNYYESPTFNFLDGKLCIAFGPTHMRKGHLLPEAPDLTPLQDEAMKVAEDICEELHFAMAMEQGDIQLVNNSVALHTRTGFEDWPEPERKRRLWRLWLVAPDMRPPTPYIQHWRGGLHLEGTKLRVELI
jgi:hypothetical protein